MSHHVEPGQWWECETIADPLKVIKRAGPPFDSGGSWLLRGDDGVDTYMHQSAIDEGEWWRSHNVVLRHP